jgi:hypothetical protein
VRWREEACFYVGAVEEGEEARETGGCAKDAWSGSVCSVHGKRDVEGVNAVPSRDVCWILGTAIACVQPICYGIDVDCGSVVSGSYSWPDTSSVVDMALPPKPTRTRFLPI